MAFPDGSPANVADARWSDLRARAASAVVMVAVAVGAILAGGLLWQVVLGAVALGTAVEWAMLCGAGRGARPVIWAAGTLYVGAAYLALLALRAGGGGAGSVLFVMVSVFGGDIGAYLAGRLIGGPRLAPALSPGKTWSGAAGGLVASIGSGTLLAAVWDHGAANLGSAAGLAACLGVVAQAGDLLESAMKRRFGKKDSSSLIPGHGGLLDRLDGLLAAAPLAALWLAVRQGAYVWQ